MILWAYYGRTPLNGVAGMPTSGSGMTHSAGPEAPPQPRACYAERVDFERLQALLRALEQHGVRYAIFGAVALNIHGLARFTEDLDIFLAPDAENIARLRAALMAVFADPDIEQITAADLLGSYPAIQYVPPDGAFHLDIVTRLGEAFRFADLETERARFGELMVTVVTPRTLYAMKKDTVRLKDRADAEMLRARFNLGEK
jgi:hypothetical protein